MRANLWAGLWLICIACTWCSGEAFGQDLGALKQRAMKAYKARRYKRARSDLLRLLPRYIAQQKRQKRGSRFWHVWLLGRSNLRYFLGQIALAKGDRDQACKHLGVLLRHLKKVPRHWPSWGVGRQLPGRFRRARRQYAKQCANRWYQLTLSGQPMQIIAEQKTPGGWVSLPLTPGAQDGTWKLRTQQNPLTLRLRAAGFTPKEWSAIDLRKTQLLRYNLEKLQPKGGTPIYKKWWFWVATVGGTAVTVALIGGIYAAATAPDEEQLKGPNGQGPFVLWKQ